MGASRLKLHEKTSGAIVDLLPKRVFGRITDIDTFNLVLEEPEFGELRRSRAPALPLLIWGGSTDLRRFLTSQKGKMKKEGHPFVHWRATMHPI